VVLASRKVIWYGPDPGSVPIHPGDTLAGYRVTTLLGRGGMGEVWAAREEAGVREVAIKVLLPRAALKPDLVRRFEREARAVAAVQSPYVCQLLGFERDGKTGAHLLVFEKLEGESLSERLRRELYLPFAEVGPILDDVWQGLVAAHAAGIIHRDLKPGNIFLERIAGQARRERAKVLDFGISKLTKKDPLDTAEPSLTDFDATLGSFAYMAPEQIRGAARVDERADVYALGAVAFRALSGRLPFEGSSSGMIMALKIDRAAPTLSEVTEEQWPIGIERFLAKALQRDRELRFGTAPEALAEWRAIQPLAAGMAQRAPRPRPSLPLEEHAPERTAVDGPPTMTEVSRPSGWDDEGHTEIDAVVAPPKDKEG
jgi:serine/threonine protein kinase